AATAYSGREVAAVPGRHVAAVDAGGCREEVWRRRVGCHTPSAAGEGRCVGGVRRVQAWSPAAARAGGAGGLSAGVRQADGDDQGAGDRAGAAPGKATLELFGPVPARLSAATKLELLGLI